jgi:WD40 repeat protein
MLTLNSIVIAQDTNGENGDQTTRDVIGRYGLLWENADAHTAEVWRVRWSPDSSKVISASLDGTSSIFDAQTGKQLLKLEGHAGHVRIAEYSPDGTRIATGSDDKTIKIWDAQTGVELGTWQGHNGAVLFLNWSYDGSRIVSCSGFDIAGVDEGLGSEIIVWNAQNGNELFRINYHQDDIMEVSFSPDGTMLASSADDREIGIWDAQTGERIKILTGSLSGVLTVQWSPDGRYLSSGSRYHWLRIWDVGTWQEVAAYTDPTEHCIRTSSWSADMTTILTTGTGNEVVIWNPDDGTIIRQIPGPVTTRCAGDYIISVQFSPDNKFFAFGTSMGRSVRVYGLGGIGASDPGANSENVPVTTVITITSNIGLDKNSLNTETFEVYDHSGKLVFGTLDYHEDTFTIIFVPGDPLEHGTHYNVELSGDVKDSSNQPLGLPYTFTFKTEPYPEASKEHRDEGISEDSLIKIGLGIIIFILIIVLIMVLQKRAKRFDW